MGVNITTIVYLRVLIIQIGSTIILMVVEAQGHDFPGGPPFLCEKTFRFGAGKTSVELSLQGGPGPLTIVITGVSSTL